MKGQQMDNQFDYSIWLVVEPPHLKNIRQHGDSSPIFGVKIKKNIWVATT